MDVTSKNTPAKIIEFIDNWKNSKGIAITEEQQVEFARELKTQLENLEYKVPVEGGIVIPYSGYYGDVPVYKVAEAISKATGI